MEKNIILVDRSYDSNVKKIGPTKARYWRTIPLNNSLRQLILDLKCDAMRLNSEHVLPRSKDWDNGDQAVPLRNFLESIKLRPIKFHALRACFATPDAGQWCTGPSCYENWRPEKITYDGHLFETGRSSYE